MKCLVCNKVFEGDSCPRCGFPVIESTNADELMEELQEQIRDYKARFENDLRVDLLIYRWKESNGTVVQDRKERMSFGNYPALRGKETWLQQKFARIPDANFLKLQICVSAGGNENEHIVQIQNLKEPSLQTVGIEADENYRLRLLLKNDLGGSSASDWLEFL